MMAAMQVLAGDDAEPQEGVAEVRTVYACNTNSCLFVARQLRKLSRHMYQAHRNHRFFECGIGGCSARPKTAAAFKIYAERYHPNEYGYVERKSVGLGNAAHQPGNGGQPPLTPDWEMIEMEDDPDNNFFERNAKDHKSSEDLLHCALARLQGKSIRLRLQLEHEHEVPAVRMKDIHLSLLNYIIDMHSSLSACVVRRLDEIGVEDDLLLKIVEGGGNLHNSLYVPPCRSKKAFQQMKIVEPIQVLLHHDDDSGEECEDVEEDSNAVEGEMCDDPTMGNAAENLESAFGEGTEGFQGNSATSRLAGVDVAQGEGSPQLHYVPILETLKLYLSDEAVVATINRKVRQVSPHFEDFSTGTYFSEHPLFTADPSALRIHLYLDEFEVCNPLGSKAGKYKMTGVYFTVGNIEQHYLSSLKSVHLAMLCRFVHVCKFGYKKILQPLVDDLLKLQTEGILVTNKSGIQKTWKGAVAFVCGDNATLNHLGGFRRCFSYGKMCRYCLTSYLEFRNVSSETHCTLRTPVAHAKHVDSVKLFPSLARTYGVSGPSPFDELGISPVKLLSPDILHEVLEGLMSFHTTNLIRALPKSKIVNLKTIIERLSNFKYGRNDKKSKPRNISEKFMQKRCHLIGSASERWTMFRILSLALGNLIPKDNQHWYLYLLGNRMFDIIMAPIVDKQWVSLLEDLVQEHHELWVQLYPDDCKFKWHVLIHYARLISSLGSLRHCWSMRFEAFHQFFIRSARLLRNFINVTHSLSWRFARRRAIQVTESCLPEETVLVGKQVSMRLKEEKADVALAICATFDVDLDEVVCWVRGAIFRGNEFQRGDVVILDVTEDGAPIFLKISDIYVVEGQVALIGQLTFVTAWEVHLHAYEVEVSSSQDMFVCVKGEDVISPQSLDLYDLNGKLFVKLHFAPAHARPFDL